MTFSPFSKTIFLISTVDVLLAVGIVAMAGEGNLGEVLFDVAHLLVGIGDLHSVITQIAEISSLFAEKAL